MNDISSDIIGHISTFLDTDECLELSTAAKLGLKKIRDRAITITYLLGYSYMFEYQIDCYKRHHMKKEAMLGVLPYFRKLSRGLLGTKRCAYFSNMPQIRRRSRCKWDEPDYMNFYEAEKYDTSQEEFLDKDFNCYYNPQYNKDICPFKNDVEDEVNQITYTNKDITIKYYPWYSNPRKCIVYEFGVKRKIKMSLTLRALVG